MRPDLVRTCVIKLTGVFRQLIWQIPPVNSFFVHSVLTFHHFNISGRHFQVTTCRCFAAKQTNKTKLYQNTHIRLRRQISKCRCHLRGVTRTIPVHRQTRYPQTELQNIAKNEACNRDAANCVVDFLSTRTVERYYI